MNFLKHISEQQKKVAKIAGVAVVGIFILMFVLSSLNSSRSLGISAPSIGMITSESVMDSVAYQNNTTKGLSVRNIAPILPGGDGGSIGGDAEEFEITEYSAFIRARHLEDVCSGIHRLKTHEYVVFENANESDRNCNYTFKVEHDHVEEILAVIESLNPRDLNVNTHTIKKLLEDYTSQSDILQSKLDAIDETLEDAINSYDEIGRVATRALDAESLAKIIDSKIRLIERLSQQRISINAQLERIERSKADQLDRLVYTYFHVSVVEDVFVDGEHLKDSWKAAIKGSIRDINRVVQDVTINLIVTLFLILQYAIYLLLILVVVKYGWHIGKHIWQK